MKENKTINRGWLSLELTGVLLIIIVAIIGVVEWIGGAFSQNDASNELAAYYHHVARHLTLMKIGCAEHHRTVFKLASLISFSQRGLHFSH